GAPDHRDSSRSPPPASFHRETDLKSAAKQQAARRMKQLQSRLPLAQPFGTRPTLRNRLRSCCTCCACCSCSCAPLATPTALPLRRATVQSSEVRTFQNCFQCKANWCDQHAASALACH